MFSCVEELSITDFSEDYSDYEREIRVEASILPHKDTAIIRIDKSILITDDSLFDCIDYKECIDCINASELEPHLLSLNVKDLSSGQRTRVAIARLINQHSQIILADEPLSNLDPQLVKEIDS